MQLDVMQDSGDDLEDIWDDLGIGLAEEQVLAKYMSEEYASRATRERENDENDERYEM